MSGSKEAAGYRKGMGPFLKNPYAMIFFSLIISRESGRDRGGGERETSM